MSKPLLAAAALAVLAAGCSGTGSPAPQVTVTVTAPASGAAAHSPQSSSHRASAAALVTALASEDPATMTAAGKLVAGPVMTRYISEQVGYDEAIEQSGQGTSSGTESDTSSGYQICYPQGGGCQSFTAFTYGRSGKITGMSVNGQTVASRLAEGPDATGGGLKITDVVSYRLTSSKNTTVVVFHVLNISDQDAVSNDPPFLLVLQAPDGTAFNYDFQNSLLSGDLHVGQSESVVATFDTSIFTGTLIVRTNGGDVQLVTSRLTKP